MKPEFLETAFAIGAQICRDAIWWEDRCNWLGDRVDFSFGRGKKLAAESLDATLYSGTIGVSLFLAHLSQRTGESWFADHAAAAARQSLRRVAEESLNPHSLHSGRFGVASGLIEVGAVLNSDEFSAQGRDLLAAVAQDDSELVGLDVIAGSAGVLLGLVDLENRHHLAPPLAYARKLVDHLCAAARESDRGISWKNLPDHDGPDLNGFAHGVSGNIAALHLANRWFDDTSTKELVAAGLRYERSWFADAEGNWPDLRQVNEAPPPEERKYMTAWCHGAPGIGLARLQLADADTEAISEARKAFATTARQLQYDLEAHTGNYSLCHGIAGNADLLLSAATILQDRELSDLANTAGQLGGERFGGSQPAWPNGFKWPGYTPSLMMGLAGVGYFFLRLDAPATTPSILGPGLASA